MAINTTPEDIIGQDDANGYLTQGVFERGMDAIINAIAKGIGKLPTLDTALNKDRTENPISNSAVATAIGDTTNLPSPTKGICENVSELNQNLGQTNNKIDSLSKVSIFENNTTSLSDWINYLCKVSSERPSHLETRRYELLTSQGWFDVVITANGDNFTGLAISLFSNESYTFNLPNNSASPVFIRINLQSVNDLSNKPTMPNLLYIDMNDTTPQRIMANNASELINLPEELQNYQSHIWGVKEVFILTQRHYMIRFTEMLPSNGRTWVNWYNADHWQGWTQISK